MGQLTFKVRQYRLLRPLSVGVVVCYLSCMASLLPHTATILLVDDYPAGMLVGTLMLEYLGYVVEGVTSGAAVIEKVQAADRPFIAILMDIQMRDMDGFAATRLIRAIEKEKGFSNTIIAVTAHAMAGDRERCITAGMNDYISKPIHPDILSRKLATLSKSALAA